ncbi:MAG: hypothetical protein AAF892_13125 [Cyanobacteria bacterium P01_D01_bin.71]
MSLPKADTLDCIKLGQDCARLAVGFDSGGDSWLGRTGFIDAELGR